MTDSCVDLFVNFYPYFRSRWEKFGFFLHILFIKKNIVRVILNTIDQQNRVYK